MPVKLPNFFPSGICPQPLVRTVITPPSREAVKRICQATADPENTVIATIPTTQITTTTTTTPLHEAETVQTHAHQHTTEAPATTTSTTTAIVVHEALAATTMGTTVTRTTMATIPPVTTTTTRSSGGQSPGAGHARPRHHDHGAVIVDENGAKART